MTLQTWAFLFLASIVALLNWGANAQPFGPSVWEQMQNQSARSTTVRVTVSALQLGSEQVLVDLTTMPNRALLKGLQLCSTSQLPILYLDPRVEILGQALRSNEVVEVGLLGSFKPCLNTVRVSHRAQNRH